MNNLNNLQDSKAIEIKKEIVKRVQDKAKAFNIATLHNTDKESVSFPVLKEGATAYVVGEGEIIEKSNINLDYVEVKLHKVATIIPVSKEQIDFSELNVNKEVKDCIADAIAKKIDADVLALLKGVATEVSATDVIEDDLNELFAKVEENNEVGAVVIPKAKKKELRALGNKADNNGAVTVKEVYGVAPTFMGEDVIAIDKERVVICVKDDVNFEILDQATITIDGNLVSLAERNLVGIKAYIYIGYGVLENTGVAKLGATA